MVKFTMFLTLKIVLGLFYKEKKVLDYEVFRKYLGPKYDDKKEPSLIISNHTSYTDVFVLGNILSPSFVAKSGIKAVPIIGNICSSMEGFFVQRESKESSTDVSKLMLERQNDFLNKKILSPLVVFPEGTVTSGRHFLLFRSGSFESQLPIKPYVLVNDDGEGVSVTTGGMNQGLHWLYILCFLYTNNLTVLELPVIYPTEYMFENHSDGVENKTHVFANVTRKIMSEVSGIALSDKTIKHSFEFDNRIRKSTDMKKQPLF